MGQASWGQGNGHLPLNQPSQVSQQLNFHLVQVARPGVNQAQGAGRGPVGQCQGVSGIKTDAWFSDHQRVICKTGVEEGIANDHDFRVKDGMGAECLVSRRFGGTQPEVGLEPLAVLVDVGH